MISFKQQINLKFLVWLGKTPTETFKLFQEVYGDAIMSRTQIFDGTRDSKREERMWKMTLRAEGQQRAVQTKMLSM